MGKQIELLPFLSGIVAQTTTHYSKDFQIDAIRLGEAAFKPELEDRTFLWMARPTGTQLVFERNVFLKETDDHEIWTHYADMSGGIQAFLTAAPMQAKIYFRIHRNLKERQCP